MNGEPIRKFEDVLAENGTLVYQIKGTSMLPLIVQATDLVIIRKPDRPLRRYDVVLYKRDDGRYVLHRILDVRADDYVICGDNQWRRETGITDRHILGLMTGLLRNGEEIPLDTSAYRRYVFFRCGLFPIRAAFLWGKALPGRVLRKLGAFHSGGSGTHEDADGTRNGI